MTARGSERPKDNLSASASDVFHHLQPLFLRYLAHPHKAKQMRYDFARKDIIAIEAALRLVQSAQQKYWVA
jgi:hypothetical protein